MTRNIKRRLYLHLQSGLLVLVIALVTSCSSYDQRKESQSFLEQHTAGAVSAESQLMDEVVQDATELPTRFQKPTFLLSETESYEEKEQFNVPVGADISSNRGPVSLRSILKRLAALKRMNVSWADDVDQMALVDVDIRAEDDFYKAIENILRQLDYFYEIDGNSIIVSYRATKTFQVAMPFLTPEFSTGVGGDVLGAGSSQHKMKGLIELKNKAGKDSFDIWANIQKNLDEILKVYTETQVEDTLESAVELDTEDESPEGKVESANSSGSSKMVRTKNQGALGYYMIDKPVGIITVTAPQSLLVKIEEYINNLQKIVYKQVSIEAKIVEVTLSEDTTTGIDWASLFSKKSFTADIDFGKLNPDFADFTTNPTSYRTQSHFFTLDGIDFSMILDAMKEQGHVEVLANPRISVLNGQPAMLSVGTDTKYVSSISVTVDEGDRTYSATTDSVVSGLGLAVVATVLNNDEVVLNLTPVTSELLEMGEAEIGNDGGFVGLPVVRLREMSSTIRVKNGNMLVVGGLIDSNNAYNYDRVVGLGEAPVLSKLFGVSGNVVNKKEMVIMLRPVILN